MPAATPVTTPVGETVAYTELDVDQVATLVTSCRLPSAIVAFAVNCDVPPTVGVNPDTLIDETVADGDVAELHPTPNIVNPTTPTNDANHRNIGICPCNLVATGRWESFTCRPKATAVPRCR